MLAQSGARAGLLSPQMKEAAVTLQHRDFASFSDADVASVLKQLDALGLLDDDDPEPKP